MSSPSSAPRPSVMQLNIKEKAALYAAYIPFFESGRHFRAHLARIPPGR